MADSIKMAGAKLARSISADRRRRAHRSRLALKTYFSPSALVSRVPVRAGGLQFCVGKRRPVQGTSVIGQHNDPSRPVSENVTRIIINSRCAPRRALSDLSKESGIAAFEFPPGTCPRGAPVPDNVENVSRGACRAERAAAPTFYFGYFYTRTSEARAVNLTVERTLAERSSRRRPPRKGCVSRPRDRRSPSPFVLRLPRILVPSRSIGDRRDLGTGFLVRAVRDTGTTCSLSRENCERRTRYVPGESDFRCRGREESEKSSTVSLRLTADSEVRRAVRSLGSKSGVLGIAPGFDICLPTPVFTLARALESCVFVRALTEISIVGRDIENTFPAYPPAFESNEGPVQVRDVTVQV